MHHYAVITSRDQAGTVGFDVQMIDAPSEGSIGRTSSDCWEFRILGTVWAVIEVDPVYTYRVTIIDERSQHDPITFKARDDDQAPDIIHRFHRPFSQFERVTLGEP
jgi:hypothetical protein